MSKKRAVIISRRHLNRVGKEIISEKVIKSNLKKLPLNIFGNILEAIIGAIYIDKGIICARNFIKKHIYNSSFLKHIPDTDFKTQLIKYAQKKGLKIQYKLEKKSGPEHQKEFFVAVFLNNKKISTAISSSIKGAEQISSEKALKIIL